MLSHAEHEHAINSLSLPFSLSCQPLSLNDKVDKNNYLLMLCECACSFYGGCVGVHVMLLPRFFQVFPDLCSWIPPPATGKAVCRVRTSCGPWQHPLCGGPTHQDGLAKAMESQLPPTLCVAVLLEAVNVWVGCPSASFLL